MENEIAEQLRTLIRESGQSMLALAQVCGVPQPRLHKFVFDKTDIRLSTAQKLFDHFGLQVKLPRRRK